MREVQRSCIAQHEHSVQLQCSMQCALLIHHSAAQKILKHIDDALYSMIWRSHALHAAPDMPVLNDRHTPELTLIKINIRLMKRLSAFSEPVINGAFVMLRQKYFLHNIQILG